MSAKSHRKTKDHDEPRAADAEVRVTGWSDDTESIRRRTFPGPAGIDESLRIAFTREAYAEVLAHAKESLEAEICGVLVGDLCEDDDGLFVDVRAGIRGAQTRSGGTHVTFTQDTWEGIHKTKEQEHPKLRIVGWYHSHPGFGVEFSQMDLFIQQNFFSGTAQFALVTDPLSGDEAIVVSTEQGVKPVGRFWVDGRERSCRGPVAASAGEASASVDPQVGAAVAKLEQRVSQMMRAVEESHGSAFRFLTGLAMFVAIAIVLWIGYGIYERMSNRYSPPKQIAEMGPILVPDNQGKTLGYMGLKAYWVGLPQGEVAANLQKMMIEQLKDPAFRGQVIQLIERIEAEEAQRAKAQEQNAADEPGTPASP